MLCCHCLRRSGCWAATVFFLCGLSCQAASAADAPASGPLRVHTENPRYFSDGSGKAVYLTGAHTWNSLQDFKRTETEPGFDFEAYLDFLNRHDHNFIRLWRWDIVSWDMTSLNLEKSDACYAVAPHPWPRTGPGNALDGKPKFDLAQFDPAYFSRLRSRVEAAGRRGIYVSVMLFEGWGLRFDPGGWKAHPFHPANNINGLEDTLPETMKGPELFTLASPDITALQAAYVRKVVDTVGDLDNVLYEIANESAVSSTQWQHHWIRAIKECEATRPKQHPVGMTSAGYGGRVDDLDRLLNSEAEWISPNPARHHFRDAPNPPDVAKVILVDTDHLWGIGGDVAWVWKSFLRGLNPILMDTYRKNVLSRSGDGVPLEQIRQAMGATCRIAAELDLAAMTPRNELASTRYCLAGQGRRGMEYVIYLPQGGKVSVDLTDAKGGLEVVWIDPVSGERNIVGQTQGGDRSDFSAPSPGDAALWLRPPQ